MKKKIILGIVVAVIIIGISGYVYMYLSQPPYTYDRGHNFGPDTSD